jgi:WD40 repeat protein
MKKMSSSHIKFSEDDKCYACHKPFDFYETVLSCKHKMCSNCLSLSLIKNKFTNITSDNITILCFCNKGKIEYKPKDYLELFHSSGILKTCTQHHQEGIEYCKTCSGWLCENCKKGFHKAFKDHKLVDKLPMKRNNCVEHNKKLVSFCQECQHEQCDECLKDHKDEHKDKIIPINDYSKMLRKEVLHTKTLQDKNDFKFITGNKEQQYRNELLEQYNEKKSKIEKLIKLLQDVLIKMKNQIDKDIKFSTDLFKILNISYDNYFNIISSDKSPISLLNIIKNIKDELGGIEVTPIPTKELNKIFGKFNQIESTELVKCKFNFSQTQVSEKQVLSFPSNHEDFMSALYKVTDNVYVSGSLDKTIKIFNMNQLNQNIEFKHNLEGHNGSIQCFASFENTQIATGSYDSTIKIWNLTEHKIVDTLEGHTQCVRCLAFVPFTKNLREQKLISGSDDCTIKIWNLNTKTLEHTIENPRSLGIRAILSLFRGSIIVSGNNNGSLCVYEGKTYNKIKALYEEGEDTSNSILCMRELDNFLFATGDKKGYIKIYDPQKLFECIQDWQGHTDWVTALVKLKDDKICSGGRDKIIQIWDIKTKQNLLTLQGHPSTIIGLDITNHDYIISGGAEGLIKVWKNSIIK